MLLAARLMPVCKKRDIQLLKGRSRKVDISLARNMELLMHQKQFWNRKDALACLFVFTYRSLTVITENENQQMHGVLR